MKNKKTVLSLLLLTSVLGFTGVTCLGNNSNLFQANADENLTVVTLNESVTNSTSFTNVNKTVGHSTFEFSKVKKGGGVGTIAAFSTIQKSTPSYGLKYVTVNFERDGNNADADKSLSLTTWYEQGDIVKRTYNGVYAGQKKDSTTYRGLEGITSGKRYAVDGNYFSIVANVFDVTINSIVLEMGCHYSSKAAKPASSNPTAVNFDHAYLIQDTNTNNHYFDIAATITFGTNKYIPDTVKIFDNNGGKEEYLKVKEVFLSDESQYQNTSTVRIRIRVDLRASITQVTNHTSGKHIWWSKFEIGGKRDYASGGDIKVDSYYSIIKPNNMPAHSSAPNNKTETEKGYHLENGFFYRFVNLWQIPCFRFNFDW